MSKDKPNIITEQELLDYLEGKITGAEANRIERQLLNSSFEEEASEGFSPFTSEEIKDDLKVLKSRLESKKHFQKPGYLSIAATVAFLIAAFGSIWFVMENALPGNQITLKKDVDAVEGNLPQVAESLIDTTISDSSSVETPSDEIENEDEQLALLETDEELQDTTTIQDITPTDEPSTTATNVTGDAQSGAGQLAFNGLAVEENLSEPVSIDTSAPEEEVNDILIEVTDSQATPRARETAAAPAEFRSAAAPAERSPITGTVYYQEDGEPLPGVTVSLGNQKVVTDLGGQFELQGSGTGAELDFSASGLRSKKLAIEDPDNVNIVLSPQPVSGQKAVILGYNSDSSKSPEPVSGSAAFVEYVNNSLQYPEASRSQQIEGTVLLKVTVSSSGSINNVEVKKSLSAACDQEAMRLIEEGPQWSPALYNGEPVEGSVRVRIIFDL